MGSLRLFSGTDSVASTSGSSSLVGGCSLERSVGRGLSHRAGRVECSALNGGSQAEGDKDSHKRGRLEGVRYEWKWHERRGPPCSWDKGSVAADSQMSDKSSDEGTSEAWVCGEVGNTPPSVNLPVTDAGDVAGSEDANDGYESPEEEFCRYSKSLPLRDASGINLIAEADTYCRCLPEVYVVLFGVGEASTEGIYSLRSHSEEIGLHVETIICFETNEDAFRFAGLLEATMTHGPSIHTIRPKDLVKFCEDSGYACRLEPKGSMMMPPEFNVGITDWERSLRLREGKYSVLEQEPEVEQRALSGSRDEMVTHEAPNPLRTSVDEVRQGLEMSDSIAMELDEVRAILERLLPDD